MKKFLICFLGTIAALLLIIYVAFLFVLPNVIDLTKYLPEIQKVVKEQADLDLSVENPKISTNWLLQAGIKTGKLSVNLPDGSTLIKTDGLKFRISLPNLIFLTVKASCVDFENLDINMDIQDEQFKVVKLIEDILNTKKDEPVAEAQPLPIDKIKIKVPNVKVGEYSININDLNTGHRLSLKGDKFRGAYNHKQNAKIKTNAKILSDEKNRENKYR